MASEVVNILTRQYDEHNVDRVIENIYKSSGLCKPKILVFDTIPACKFAYKLLLSYINNNSGNLTDEHGNIKISNLNNEISKDVKLSLYNIVKIIEKYYDNFNSGFSALPEIKTQFLKDLKPSNISIDSWNNASEETKNVQREKVWNNIINNKENFFNYKPENYISYFFSEGILFGIFLKYYCILCKNPKKILERKPEELHSTDGYAIEFNDGNGLYFVNNIQFEPELYSRVFVKKDITAKEILKINDFDKVRVILQYFDHNKFNNELCANDIKKITNIELLGAIIETYDHNKFIKEILGKEILKIKNVEIRAVLIQFYGYDNLIKELDAKLIDANDEFNNIDNLPLTNELWEFEMKVGRRNVLRKFRFVKVEDWSTRKKVTLGIPISEETNTVIGALAWTFRMTKEEYILNIQT